MNAKMLSSPFLSFYWALSWYLLPDEAKYLFNSKAPNIRTSPLSQSKSESSQAWRTRVTLQPTCAFHRCSLKLWAWERLPTPLPSLENISSGPPAFLYLGSGKETIMKLTEVPESRMTSLHENSLRRWQAEAWRKRRKNIHGEKFAFGLPTSFCMVSRIVLEAFQNEHVCSLTNHPTSLSTEHSKTLAF